jgi:hypothetical protein
MPLKVESIFALYGSLLEAHFDALEAGYVRSLHGTYSSNHFFRDWAEAMTRAGTAWTAPWDIVFPETSTRTIEVVQKTPIIEPRMFLIPDPGSNAAVPKAQKFYKQNATPEEIPCEVTVVYMGKRTYLMVEVKASSGLKDAGPTTDGIPYICKPKTAANVEVATLKLQIVPA